MGLIPMGERRSSAPARLQPTPADAINSNVPMMVRVQAAFLFCGALVGVFGILLPHPDTFMTRELVLLNCVSWATAIGSWILAPRVSPTALRWMPAFGTLLITVAVIFTRDATSAYALLYLFPCVYAYYFLKTLDAGLHIAFAAVNYAVAIMVVGWMSGAADVTSGSVIHHLVITVGSLVVVGAMLVYLRRRVERLMEEVMDSARTDLTTGLLNSRGLTENLVAELERSRMNAGRVSLLCIQVSGLMDVRARRGDEFSGELLGRIGRLLDDSTRRIDVVARTGTAEFCVTVPETDESTAFMLSEQILVRLRRSFREWEVSLAGSVGVAAFPKHAATAEALNQSAATACEAAKALGGDRAAVYSLELEDVLAGDPSRALVERRTHLSTVLSLAEVLDLRDSRTALHSQAVARYAELIARELGLPEQRVQRLKLAGFVHDIGKVGVADAILQKPGPLSPEEWDEVRRHPEMAARILGARELADIREWILARHEQPDGHGYPRGLREDAIPLESRILAVAESYDAMTSERPYRPSRTREEAIAELGRYAGTQFDGRVVDALLKILDSEPIASEV
jgi:diguanylate cyclase (GGDEF)-like protein